jgi:hypothetical protein
MSAISSGLSDRPDKLTPSLWAQWCPRSRPLRPCVRQSPAQAPRTCLTPWVKVSASTRSEKTFTGLTYLSDQDCSTHVRPASAVVSKLREDCRCALLDRGHYPKTDYNRNKAEDVDTAENTFCQWEVLCAEDVEGCHCDHRNPGEQGALPALGSVCGVVDHDQCLHEATNDERVHRDN